MPVMAKPCGTSQSCSRLVTWKKTESPTCTPSMLSGTKWLRMLVILTWTVCPWRLTPVAASLSAAYGSALVARSKVLIWFWVSIEAGSACA